MPAAFALAESTVAAPELWGVANNPASAIGRSGYAIQAYGVSRYGLRELTSLGLDVAYGRATSSYTLGLQHFGPPGYSLTGLHLGARRDLSREVSLGLRIGLLAADYDEYGRRRLPTAQIGLQYQLNAGLRTGICYSYARELALPLLEHRLDVGVDYASSERVHLLLALRQPAGERLGLAAGIHYAAAERLSLRAGFRTVGTAFTLGVEYTLPRGVLLSIGASADQRLPLGVAYGGSYFWD